MSNQSKIEAVEKQIFELKKELTLLRKENRGEEVPNYEFLIEGGALRLNELFGDKDKLLVIHNMGQGCRYCTLWADGLNGFLPHLESTISVVLASKDAPKIQRKFANSRGWRFRLVSHGGREYLSEQSVMAEAENMPGAVMYEKVDGKIYRKNAVIFGPGDSFCSAWDLLSLAGFDSANWTPQFNYWQRPQKMDDGGKDLV